MYKRLATIRKRARLGYTFIAKLPNENQVLLRESQYQSLELWRPALGTESGSIIFNGVELEFVREVNSAYRVIDTEYNRKHNLDLIGCVIVGERPTRAVVKEL